MDQIPQEKGKAFVTTDSVDYILHSVLIKTIIKKATGHVTVSALDDGEGLSEKTSPFDTFIQVIDGRAEIVINDHPQQLETGESIIIPAHSRNRIKANERFKIITTLIKSGYEDLVV